MKTTTMSPNITTSQRRNGLMKIWSLSEEWTKSTFISSFLELHAWRVQKYLTCISAT
uniref:Uncharacterized protein n=1 Tax=Anguilla anguilla TaxID=7936 RepID=A0A0E9WI35_ANGAN